MIKLKDILIENEIVKYDSNILKSSTFDDFLKSLVGIKMQSLLDGSLFSRMYLMNKYGFSNDEDSEDLTVLKSRLLNALTDYINFKKIGPWRDALDGINKSDSGTPEYKEWHTKFYSLAKQILLAKRAGNEELVAKLRAEKDKLSPPKNLSGKSYDEHMKDMQDLVKQFHNSKLTLQDVLPNSDDRPQDKDRYEKAKRHFETLKDRLGA